MLGESGASCNSFYSNTCSVKSVEYLKPSPFYYVVHWLHFKETSSNRSSVEMNMSFMFRNIVLLQSSKVLYLCNSNKSFTVFQYFNIEY